MILEYKKNGVWKRTLLISIIRSIHSKDKIGGRTQVLSSPKSQNEPWNVHYIWRSLIFACMQCRYGAHSFHPLTPARRTRIHANNCFLLVFRIANALTLTRNGPVAVRRHSTKQKRRGRLRPDDLIIKRREAWPPHRHSTTQKRQAYSLRSSLIGRARRRRRLLLPRQTPCKLAAAVRGGSSSPVGIPCGCPRAADFGRAHRARNAAA